MEKHGKLITAIVFVLSAIALCALILLKMGEDKTKPEIKFAETALVYETGMKQEALLTDITATDKEDGDLTDRIVIEKITENEKKKTATITYAVNDSAGNVQKASRVLPLTITKTTEQQTQTDDQIKNQITNQIKKEENKPQTASKDTTENTAQDADTQTDNRENSDTESESDKDARIKALEAQLEQIEQENEEENRAQIDAAVEERLSQIQAEETQREIEQAEQAGIPKITLKSTVIVTTVGRAPAWVEAIQSLSDDTDNYNTLFSTLQYTKYDLNKKGTYPVALTVTDTDGNTSEAVTINVVVK